jgi:hypothetical protein
MKCKFQILDSIFTRIYLKLNVNLVNVSGEYLSFDQFKKEVKIYVLNSVLNELKSFLLTDVYYRSKNLYSKFESYIFFELILLRVKKVLQNEISFLLQIESSSSEFNWLLKYLENEEGELVNLVLYLITVRLFSENSDFVNGFDCIKLVTAILENLIVKISNVFLYLIFFNSNIHDLTYLDRFCLTVDFLKTKKNNFYWQAYLASTFLKPKYIYYNLYNLKVLNKHGISTKVIYISKLKRKLQYKLSNIQLAVLFYFEFIDFIYPKFFRISQKSSKFVHFIFT